MRFSALFFVLSVAVAVCGQQTIAPPNGTAWQYVLLNDTSGRTLWPGGIEQQANTAARFLKEVVRPGSDVGTLVNFNEESELTVESSTNPDELAAKLERHGRNGTGLYDAIIAAAEWLGKQHPSDKVKLVFVFSDGDDDASQTTLQDAILSAKRVHISVIVISPAVVEHKRQGKNLQELAKSSGGHAYFVRDTDSFDFTPLKQNLGR